MLNAPLLGAFLFFLVVLRVPINSSLIVLTRICNDTVAYMD